MNLVCIGGGNGASQVMKGMRGRGTHITGVIAVTDSGRSTGKIRIAVDIPAPGDIRNALLTLSTADQDIKDLFQFRFRSKKLAELDGMAFGNLFIAALAQMKGNFEQAVAETADFLQVDGRVLPVTLYNTHLCAELENGKVVCEELNVRGLGKPPIKRLFLKNRGVTVNPEVVRAITRADVVTIGPGSLFTTVIACLLARGLKEALQKTRGKIVFILNTTTQPGQTDGYSLVHHVEQIERYLGRGVVTDVLVNTRVPPAATLQEIRRQGLTFLQPESRDVQAIEDRFNVRVHATDLIERSGRDANLWDKVGTVRHDPKKVARALQKIRASTRR